MILLPVRLRRRAEQDVERAIDHLRDAAGETVALSFVEDLQRTLDMLSRHPASGSPRHGHELGLPGLRHGALADHPWLVFYLETPTHLDVWRVLHGHRDLRGQLRP